jgi:hypothetical protein
MEDLIPLGKTDIRISPSVWGHGNAASAHPFQFRIESPPVTTTA